jgi:hypothetical protein
VRYESGGVWSAYQSVQAGDQQVLGAGIDGIDFEPLDSSGQNVAISSSFLFDVTFATTGTFTGSLAATTDGVSSVPAELAFAQQPTSAISGQVIAPSVVVNVENFGGTLLTSDGSNVTLAISGGPAGAVLGGTTTVTAVNGVATFGDLSVSEPGTYVLTATDGLLAAATSTQFTVRALRLHSSYTSSALATGKISPVTGDSPLTASATVTNALDLWLGVSTTDTGSATESASGSVSTAFGADGLISPGGKAAYSTTFSAVGDRVTMGLSMTAAASELNLLDMVLPVSSWKPSSVLVDELDKIYKATAFGSAAADLRAGAAGQIGASSAAHGIADYIADLFADDDAQWDQVRADLRDAGVVLTATELDTLESTTRVDRLAKALIANAQLDTQFRSGAPIDVAFFANVD